MARFFSLLLCGLAAVSFSAAAAKDDDGFIWIDANTRIKVTPTGKSAAGGETKAPEPSKEKKEKRKK
jgi:hypothetical protein